MAKTPGKKNVQAAAEIAAAAAEAAVEKAKESSKSRGPRGVPESAVISDVAPNPKREGSKAHGRYAAYRDGMTVGEALDAGITTPDLVYDAKHGFIKIDGYDPGEIVQPKPKAEKKAKAPKAPKKGKAAKAAPSDEEVAAAGEADAVATEESMD